MEDNGVGVYKNIPYQWTKRVEVFIQTIKQMITILDPAAIQSILTITFNVGYVISVFISRWQNNVLAER